MHLQHVFYHFVHFLAFCKYFTRFLCRVFASVCPVDLLFEAHGGMDVQLNECFAINSK